MGKEAGRENAPAVRHAFVVRIWREEGRAEWRGWVQHALTGDSSYVQDVTALVDFIEQRVGGLAVQPRDNDL